MPLLECVLPVVGAPMAGGVTTPALASAVSAAGGFPVLAAGYLAAEALAEQVAQVRRSGKAFGVNLFAPSVVTVDEAAYRRYAARLQPDADRYGLDLTAVPLRQDDDGWREKTALLLADPVPVVTVTFGLPPAVDLDALRRAGSRVLATVTSVAEARAAADAGVDGLVAQGSSAGGHSGTHHPSRPAAPQETAGLVADVVRATGLPVVAAGGVDGPEAVAALLHAGAQAVAVGTLLLRTDESGASPAYRAALADPRFEATAITRAFTGRPARALRNRFLDRHDAAAPLGYPAVHHLTRGLRQAAAAAREPHDLHLWAGTGWRSATPGPAGEVVRRLAQRL